MECEGWRLWLHYLLSKHHWLLWVPFITPKGWGGWRPPTLVEPVHDFNILSWVLSHYRWVGEFLVVTMHLHTSLSRLGTSQLHLQGHNELIEIESYPKVFTASFCTHHIPLWSGLCCIIYCPRAVVIVASSKLKQVSLATCTLSHKPDHSSCSYLFQTFCSYTSLKFGGGKDYIDLL